MAITGLRHKGLERFFSRTWAVRVSANWRVTFRFEGPDVTDVDYEDYH